MQQMCLLEGGCSGVSSTTRSSVESGSVVLSHVMAAAQSQRQPLEKRENLSSCWLQPVWWRTSTHQSCTTNMHHCCEERRHPPLQTPYSLPSDTGWAWRVAFMTGTHYPNPRLPRKWSFPDYKSVQDQIYSLLCPESLNSVITVSDRWL